MTDPKPAPPATDDCICEDVRVLGACPVHEPRSTEPANDNLVAAWLADLQGMDDADREHDVTVLDTRSLLLRIAADAETIKAQAEEIERMRKVRTGSAVERLHNLCDGFEESDKAAEAELATLRAQVETLREALADIKAKADFQIPPYAYGDNEAACDMAHRLTQIVSIAEAATEPKG